MNANELYATLGGLYPHILVCLTFFLLIAKISIYFAISALMMAVARLLDRSKLEGHSDDQ